jgi:hypothetical protein
MKNILPWICMVLFASMPLMAQESTTERGGRQAWFVQTAMPEGLENPVKVLTGKNDIQLLELSNRLASGPLKIPADGVVRLVREEPDPEDPRQTIFLTLAQAKIPAGMNQALVLLVPTPRKEGSDLLFQTRVQGLTDFKGGDFLYINLTNMNVAVEIGKTKIPLKPGTTRIYQGQATAEPRNLPFRYSYFHPEKEKWTVLSASLMITSSTRREIFVFSVDGTTARVKCHGITFPVM